ncbi:crotonobetainyl-CoA hydratase [Pseudomaricurvus alkylphenolicus]|uniref:enoyl-CoA hydratase-related protein n=1 Tax=Pseudomaricurvus alkylphenolicus TaxID=1306991 RepID=UPI001423B4E2|nr:enoyl-CoA hydratase-related protein [Pseudomaricurvus alkylphenolicus]NIB40608.1 crotonobetainyl-CoA hydratase [Pseudomaricurvus alkylphenolicus]
MTDAVKTNEEAGIFEITLDRPKANAIDAATSRALGEAFAYYRDSDHLRCAIITGGGERIFSAGWDLKAAAEHGENENQDYGVGGFAGITEMFDLLKPVIAAVNGVAVGGGVEIALASDIVVAADHASFSLPETSVGVVADAGGVQRLPRKIPHNIAMDMLLTGRVLPASEAAHWGLVNYVVPASDVMERARDIARSIVDGAPLSVKAIKEIVATTDSLSVEEQFHRVRNGGFPVFEKMLQSEDHIEGPRAFAEKRKPQWQGK